MSQYFLGNPLNRNDYKKNKRVEMEIRGTVLNHQKMNEILLLAAQELKKELYNWLGLHVPYATGRLYRSILYTMQIHAVMGNRIRNHKLRVFFGSSVEYIQYVDRMGDRNVLHNGQRRIIRGNKVVLNDPSAFGGFFGEFINEVCQQMKDVLLKVLSANGFGGLQIRFTTITFIGHINQFYQVGGTYTVSGTNPNLIRPTSPLVPRRMRT
jgi:hypothetical protein